MVFRPKFKQAKSGKYTANKYKFLLKEGVSEESDEEPDLQRQLLEARGLLPVQGTALTQALDAQ